MKQFQGQTVLVTGASGGIGRAIAIQFAAEGANVILHYSHNRQAAEETAEACRRARAAAEESPSGLSSSEGCPAGSEEGNSTGASSPESAALLLVQANLESREETAAMFARMKERNSRLDVLVCNAGITRDGLMLTMKPEDFDQVVRTNLYGTFYCMQEAARLMLRQRYGRIIAISSIVGLHGNAGQTSYAASKSGIIGMVKSLAKELASRHITVNAVAPGMIDTEMTRSLPENVRQAMLHSIPAGRAGTPAEVADAVTYLARKSSGYITAQVLGVDGGMGA